MKRNIIITTIAVILTALAFSTGTAQAAVDNLIGSQKIRDNSIRSVDVRDGSVGVADLRDGAVSKLSGSDGEDGAVGSQGEQGPQGEKGPQGEPGQDAQALPYGVAKVNVSRGGSPAGAWGTYSTTIGGPEGDTTGGTFRFTCAADKAPCTVSVAAYSTGSDVKVHPRVSIQTESLNGGPQTYCEYGDGTGSDTGFSGALTAEPSALPIHIGGSADCDGPDASTGAVDKIVVPAGYYDVTSTFTFVG